MWRNAARARVDLPENRPGEWPRGITNGIGGRITRLLASVLCSWLPSLARSAEDCASPLALGGTS